MSSVNNEGNERENGDSSDRTHLTGMSGNTWRDGKVTFHRADGQTSGCKQVEQREDDTGKSENPLCATQTLNQDNHRLIFPHLCTSA